MGGGGPDVHPDAQDDDLVFIDERAPGAGEENTAAVGLVVTHGAMAILVWRI